MRRGERLLWRCETTAASAQESGDMRLVLLAARDARSALETLAKATGLIGGDAPVVNVALNAQVRHVMAFEDALRVVMAEIPERGRATLLRAFLAARDSAAPVIEGDFKALSP